jgi:hypothetical protein
MVTSGVVPLEESSQSESPGIWSRASSVEPPAPLLLLLLLLLAAPPAPLLEPVLDEELLVELELEDVVPLELELAPPPQSQGSYPLPSALHT